MLLNSISKRITLSTLTVTMAIVLFLGMLSYHYMRVGLTNQINQHIEHHADTIAERTERILALLLEDIRNMSENLIVVNALIDSTGRDTYVRPFFLGLKLSGNMPFALTLCDFEGKPIISNLKNAPSYRRAEYTKVLIDQERPMARIDSRDEGPYIEMAYPVFYGSTGMAEGFLIVDIGLDHIMGAAMGHEPSEDMGHHVSVVQSGETVWSAGKKNSEMHAISAQLNLPGPLDELGLSVEYIEGKDSISLPIRRLSIAYLIAGFVSLTLAFLASRTMSLYISSPITSLSRLAEETARTGSPTIRVGGEKDRPDEVGVLARSLDTMLERLRESHDALDTKVRERTGELESANTALRLEVSERKNAEERFRTVVTGAPIVFFRIDKEGIFTLSEGMGLNALGLRPGEVVGRSVFDVYASFPEIVGKIRASLKGTPVRFMAQVGQIWFDTTVTPILDADGNVLEALGVANDITGLKRTESTLHEANSRLALSQFVLDNAGDAIFLSGPDAGLVYVNEAACLSLGYSRDELLGMRVVDLDPEYPIDQWPAYWERLKQAGKMTFETQHRRKDGLHIPVEVTATYFRHGDREYDIGFARNVAKRKKAEAEINRSLREKEVLLKEIHHRVKNNMAIISSLLNLQSSSIDDAHVQNLLSESRGRIQTMALVHEQLYKSRDFLQIDAKDYIESLACRLSNSLENRGAKVKVEVEVDDIKLGMDQLIPLGLILNELLTNCYKYAFTGRGEGTIHIRLVRDNSAVRLCIKDNGHGLRAGLDLKGSQSLGMKLIEALSLQLEGELEVRSGDGLEVSVIFDAKEFEQG